MESKSQKNIGCLPKLDVSIVKIKTKLRKLTFEDISVIQNKEFKVTYIENRKPKIISMTRKDTADTE